MGEGRGFIGPVGSRSRSRVRLASTLVVCSLAAALESTMVKVELQKILDGVPRKHFKTKVS